MFGISDILADLCSGFNYFWVDFTNSFTLNPLMCVLRFSAEDVLHETVINEPDVFYFYKNCKMQTDSSRSG